MLIGDILNGGDIMAKVSKEVLKRYQDKAYRRYTVRVRNDGQDGITPQILEAEADTAGQSVNEYIVQAIEEKITKQLQK